MLKSLSQLSKYRGMDYKVHIERNAVIYPVHTIQGPGFTESSFLELLPLGIMPRSQVGNEHKGSEVTKGCLSFHGVFAVLFSGDTLTGDTAGTDGRQKEFQID